MQTDGQTKRRKYGKFSGENHGRKPEEEPRIYARNEQVVFLLLFCLYN